jgi:hypothetical protein
MEKRKENSKEEEKMIEWEVRQVKQQIRREETQHKARQES